MTLTLNVNKGGSYAAQFINNEDLKTLSIKLLKNVSNNKHNELKDFSSAFNDKIYSCKASFIQHNITNSMSNKIIDISNIFSN